MSISLISYVHGLIILKPGFMSLLNFPNYSTIPASIKLNVTCCGRQFVDTTTLAAQQRKWIGTANAHEPAAGVAGLHERFLSELVLLVLR
jgi:hypothetical protein